MGTIRYSLCSLLDSELLTMQDAHKFPIKILLFKDLKKTHKRVLNSSVQGSTSLHLDPCRNKQKVLLALLYFSLFRSDLLP